MSKSNLFLLMALPVVLTGYLNCSGTAFQSAGSSNSSSSSSSGSSGVNTMSITIGCQYVNEPCVSVTICQPGTSSCQTIPNVLLDTGSYGLRLFSSTVGLSLNSVSSSSGGTYAECVSYADGSSDWGPVKLADIYLGSQRAANVPMQIINASYGAAPSDCTGLDSSPADAGFNGILGVGQLVQDCGTDCVTVANNRTYFSCIGSSCTPTTIPLADQVTNPVAMLPSNNNGVVLVMPSVSDSGTTSDTGMLIFGIGTQVNNTASGVTVLEANADSEFNTIYQGTNYSQSFIDSGSNGLFFPPTGVSVCGSSSQFSGWFCPGSVFSLTAIQESATSSTEKIVSFKIGNASNYLASSMMAFDDLGAEYSDGFDWGMPFFYGRSVYVGIAGRSSNLGMGPYWAF